MKAFRSIISNPIPIIISSALLLVAILLVVFIPRLSVNLLPGGKSLANLSIVSGDVRLSDGIYDVAAKIGPLKARKGRTLLKTGEGIAILKIQNGSLVVVDWNSTIEFGRDIETDPAKFFPFNLVKGRMLVISGESGKTFTQVLIGGLVTARMYHAIIGLEVQPDQEYSERVDCLVGDCLVNGAYLVIPGQSARFKPGNSIRLTGDIPYDTWVALANMGKINVTQLIMPTTAFSTATLVLTKMLLPVTGNNSAPTPTLTASFTFTSIPTATVTPSPTPTNTRIRLPLPTRTPTPRNESPRPATPLPTSTTNPTRTPIPSSTDTPVSVRTSTDIPFPTYTHFPTVETPLVPTNTPTEIVQPTQQPTQPAPTETPVPTVIPTEVVSPTTEVIPTLATTPPPRE